MHSSLGMGQRQGQRTPRGLLRLPQVGAQSPWLERKRSFRVQTCFLRALSRASLPPQACGTISAGPELSSAGSSLRQGHPAGSGESETALRVSQIPSSGAPASPARSLRKLCRKHARLAVLSLGVWGGPVPRRPPALPFLWAMRSCPVPPRCLVRADQRSTTPGGALSSAWGAEGGKSELSLRPGQVAQESLFPAVPRSPWVLVVSNPQPSPGCRSNG